VTPGLMETMVPWVTRDQVDSLAKPEPRDLQELLVLVGLMEPRVHQELTGLRGH